MAKTSSKETRNQDTDNIKSYQYDEDEIDLRELLSVVKKRKFIVIAVTAFVLAIAVIYILTAQPLYEAKATLEIGHQIAKTKDGQIYAKYFDKAERIKQYIDTKYDTAGKYRKKGTKTFIKEVDIPRKANQFVTITSYGLNNKLAVNKLKEALDDVINNNKMVYLSTIELTKHNIDINQKRLFLLKNQIYKKLEHQLVKLNTEIAKRQTMIKQLTSSANKIEKKNNMLAALLLMKISNIQNEIGILSSQVIDSIQQKNTLIAATIPDLEKEIGQLKMSIVPPYLVKTHIVGEIYTHDYPVKPKKKLIVVVALITGLILGLFLAFFLEFIGKEKD